jgi:hypothetical protein
MEQCVALSKKTLKFIGMPLRYERHMPESALPFRFRRGHQVESWGDNPVASLSGCGFQAQDILSALIR